MIAFCRPRLVATGLFWLVASLIFAQNRIVLVDFGAAPAGNQYSNQYPAWNQVIRSTATTEYVSGANPAYEGITEVSGGSANWENSWIGLRGAMPINFTTTHRVICTWFNRSGGARTLHASISLTDSTAAAGATLDAPWYAMYQYLAPENAPTLQPGERGELFYNVTNAASVLSAGSPPSAGNRWCINICRRFYDPEAGDLVLEKIELATDADNAPPNAPLNLAAQMVSLVPGEPPHAVRLTWQKPADPPAAGQHASGISRYFIYRNGVLFDAVDENWAGFFGQNVAYTDDSALPGQTYTYAVTALDRAIKGRCASWHNLATMRHGNESAQATTTIAVPSFALTTVFNPFGALQYKGKIKLNDVGYAGRSMTCNPFGNPNYNPATELPGSLYFTGHAQVVDVAEINIPKPVNTNNYALMPAATYLQPFTFAWPNVYFYGGSWHPFPQGSVDRWVGLGWHPGANGGESGVFYSTFMTYSGDLAAPSHGWINLGLDSTVSPWAFDDPDVAGEQRLPFTFTGKLIAAAPQGWANANLGGKSLLTGLGWPISGQGWPSCGPSLYASQPWENGNLPAADANVACAKLLRYGTTFETEHWQRNWTQTNNYQNAAWASSGANRHALAIAGQLSIGDNWYGGEQGDQSKYRDWDVPFPPTGSNFRGQQASRFRSMIQFYNPADLAAVAAGSMEAHEPQPYATLNVTPYLLRPDTDAVNQVLRAIAVDNVHGYLYAYETEYNYQYQPVIHVWKINPPTCDAPSGVALSPSFTTATMTWDFVPGASSYQVQRKKSNTATWSGTATVTGTSHTFTGLTVGTDYDFRVRTKCGSTWSAYANISAATLSCGVPTSLVASNLAATSATLSWIAPPGATLFRVYYRPKTSATWLFIDNVPGNTLTINGLTPGTIYYAKVRTKCGATLSGYSAQLQFATPATFASAPSEPVVSEFVGENDDLDAASPATAASLLLLPNPAREVVRARVHLPEEMLAELVLTDACGKLLQACALIARDGGADFDLRDFPPGIYFVRLSAAGQSLSVARLVKI